MRNPVAAAVLLALVGGAAPAAAQAPKPAPDLWIKHIETPRGPFAPGARLVVSVTVENRGNAPALGSGRGGYMVDVSLGVRPAGFPPREHTVPAPYRFVEGMLLAGGRMSRTDDLPPHASRVYSAEVQLPLEIKPGTYWLGLTVDPFETVPEPQPHPRGEHDNVTNVDVVVEKTR